MRCAPPHPRPSPPLGLSEAQACRTSTAGERGGHFAAALRNGEFFAFSYGLLLLRFLRQPERGVDAVLAVVGKRVISPRHHVRRSVTRFFNLECGDSSPLLFLCFYVFPCFGSQCRETRRRNPCRPSKT